MRILALAAREDLTVSDYVHVLGQSQPRVSRHLKLLVEAGLLERFREAQFTRFRLAPSGEDAALVGELRDWLWSSGEIEAKVIEGKQQEGAKYSDYFEHAEAVAKIGDGATVMIGGLRMKLKVLVLDTMKIMIN